MNRVLLFYLFYPLALFLCGVCIKLQLVWH